MAEKDRKIRVLIGKVGFDPHDRGILILSRGLKDAGMEVIFLGKFLTAEEVVMAAIDENVDVIALSDHCGVMRLIATDVMELLKKKGASHICVVAGGIIPDEDKPLLEELGVTGNYGMGTPMTEIIDHINEQVNEMRVGVG
ncbi:MAG: cobalamin-dependent protein [Desulfobacterales bacterium]|jgi:methylmalonyl-CoA mutase C-terminal domain/subunit